MSHDHDLSRLHNPWEKFTHRDEKKHNAENDLAFRLGQPLYRLAPTPPPQPLSTRSTREVIDVFLDFGSKRLDDPIPRQRQLLKDFLLASDPPLPSLSSSRPATAYFHDIDLRSAAGDIALIDDRNYHQYCARKVMQTCSDCYIYSQRLTIPELCNHLQGERKTPNGNADRRICFIPNLTSAGALVLAATCARRSAIPIREYLHRYLGREHMFSSSTSRTFTLQFHIPYHAMRRGPLRATKDSRRIDGKRLRKSSLLPLESESRDQENLYYHEAQISSLSWGPDETFWSELFLVDTYFGSEERLLTYLDTPSGGKFGDGSDPPLGGQGSMEVPIFNPREYFLTKIDRRIEQVATEYRALVETFNKRMEEYARKIRKVFVDDPQRTNTETLSNVIETTHIFVDCLSGIIDAWETFSRTEITLFTIHAQDKPTWREILIRIERNMSELDRLRKLLMTKRERFKFKLESLHTVSSLSQTETANMQAKTAVSQGDDLKTLTQMTVYVAFPLLFTTAFFSMSFANPPYPWAVFSGVLMCVSLINYMIASQSSPGKACRDLWELCKKEWTMLRVWSSEILEGVGRW